MAGPPAVASVAAGGPSSAELIDRFESLIGGLEQIGDPADRERAEELVGAIVDLYGEGLRRTFAILEGGGEQLEPTRQALSGDSLVASLMLIHDLYPVDLPTRVSEALDSVRPYMESHGGNVELISLLDGVARIRLEGSCKGCAASSSTLELAIKQALDDAAPDLVGLEVEGTIEETGLGIDAAAGGTALPMVSVGEPGEPIAGATNGSGSDGARWRELEDAATIAEGEMSTRRAGGRQLLLARVGGDLLAYRDSCANCGDPVSAGELSGGIAKCPSCGRRYDLPKAGREAGGAPLQLEPVPLLADAGAGEVRVAISA